MVVVGVFLSVRGIKDKASPFRVGRISIVVLPLEVESPAILVGRASVSYRVKPKLLIYMCAL